MKNNKAKKRLLQNVRDINSAIFIFSILGGIACSEYGGPSIAMLIASITSITLVLLSNYSLRYIRSEERLAKKRMFIRPMLK